MPSLIRLHVFHDFIDALSFVIKPQLSAVSGLTALQVFILVLFAKEISYVVLQTFVCVFSFLFVMLELSGQFQEKLPKKSCQIY